MADHLAFLAKLGPQMIGAGPLFDGTEGHGGIWLVEAGNPADVQALVEQDPFWPTGLRKNVQILEWRQVFRNGQRV
ncbi:YciI family protein [Tropicibacter sp. Alg240-R139]|uniref:YciI family protein n=1 Tax=Tropicibacter sp. Alg240-R139 TaxID=2305991 RepID=UPI0035935066